MADAELSSPRAEASRVESSPFAVKPGTVTSKNGILTIDGATNSKNNIIVMGDGGAAGTMVADQLAPLVPGVGCRTADMPMSIPFVQCDNAVHIVVRVGSGDDRVFVNGGSAATTDIDGGAGNDVVTTETSSDYISGGTGADTIKAGGGDDVLIGGSDAGFDTLNGGAGGDDCHQGESYMNCDNGVVNDNAVR